MPFTDLAHDGIDLPVIPTGRYTPNPRRDRQMDVDRQAVRSAVLGFDRALHRLDIAPRDRQPDPEPGCPVGFAAPAGREIPVENLIELCRWHTGPAVDDLDMRGGALLPEPHQDLAAGRRRSEEH